MKLSIKALAITSGAIWASAVLLISLANLVWPGYGVAFLEITASIYPGLGIGGLASVITGSVFAFADAAIGGAIFAWLYNRLAA